MVVLDSRAVKEQNSHGGIMASYFHCNSCYFRPGFGAQRHFFITNCSHLYCEPCVAAATKDKCKVCKSQCSTLCLTGKVPKEVESMFIDPVESFKKFQKEYLLRLEFQRSHQKRLMKYMTDQINAIEKKMNEVIPRFQQLERAYYDLKSQNEYLKLLLSKKDGCPRGGSRAGTSPGSFNSSPSVSHSAGGKNQNFPLRNQRPSGLTDIAVGRLSIRTPPSGGRLGTVGGTNYTSTTNRMEHTPESNCGTPLTIPRPIRFNKTD